MLLNCADPVCSRFCILNCFENNLKKVLRTEIVVIKNDNFVQSQ